MNLSKTKILFILFLLITLITTISSAAYSDITMSVEIILLLQSN